MREHGVEANDKAKHHNGLHNVIVDEQEISLKFHRDLLNVPLRETTDEDLQQWPILYFTSDDPWDPQVLDNQDPNPNHFRKDPTCHNHFAKLGKIIGTEER